MRKTLFVMLGAAAGLLSLLPGAGELHAQELPQVKRFTYGLKAGVTASTLFSTTMDNDGISSVAGAAAGAFGEYRFTRVFGLSAGVSYGREGAKMDVRSMEIKFRVDRLYLPVMADFYLGKARRFALKAGLAPSFRIGDETTVAGRKVDMKRRPTAFVLGTAYGLSYDFKCGLLLEALYNLSYDDKFLPDAYYGTFAFNIGYRFGTRR